ncbi:MAG: quinoprotein dehydrogenase-associated SoxYZ-like carrier [Burkholderiales bacterium]
MRWGWLGLLLLAYAALAEDGRDPLASARWEDMRRQFFGDQAVVFDDRVKVTAPQFAEDSMSVPVRVDAEALPEVREIVVFADFNPILKVLEFYPEHAKPQLAFRFKLQQASPVRAAARTGDGVWHVGGTWVDAAGGGCTAPGTGRAAGGWEKLLNEVTGRVWTAPDAGRRLRLRVMHPMDTGLAPGIPAFYIEQLTLRDERGTTYFRLNTFEPVAENPIFTFDLPARVQSSGALVLSGVDNNGNRIASRLTP